jgi:hypothetical protein
MNNSLNKYFNESFKDNIYLLIVLYVILILYSSIYFKDINIYVGNLYKKYKFLNIINLLLILYLGKKYPVIGILLGISYIISLNYYKNNKNCSIIGNSNYDSYCIKNPQKSINCISKCSTKIPKLGYVCCESSCCS